ncbi:type II secretion system minor pseudopilin GspK [Motiliproteus sp. MSK22-1]|uniref:type II secretion system minor pseudopilin GspK n=1 Tax=Motiliproteus sp. MSK22-1 TaxID=1897630 RepID=UPI000978667A|nr:type II secretion system minor pseudopilin GspK [Motiliproteus sp. MSK22-1]OMH34787.1 hypothetical protein BGP75_10805 [Motiliproteus sp. MSK22-1]
MRRTVADVRLQRGMALIVVLLVVAVIATLATAVSSRVQFNVKKSQNRSQQGQAYWYALGGEELAQQLLKQALFQDNDDQVNSVRGSDDQSGAGSAGSRSDNLIYLGQSWSQGPHHFPFEGGGLALAITDQQACFNINVLTKLTTAVSQDTQALDLNLRQFRSLLKLLEFESEEISRLQATIQDWLDKDVIPTGLEGFEDLHYSGITPPYQSANGPVQVLSELNLITGFKSEYLTRLEPFFCALPYQEQRININTITEDQALLISGLFDETLSVEEARILIQNRPAEGFSEVAEFWQQLPLEQLRLEPEIVQHLGAIEQQLTVSSKFFLATIDVNYYDARMRLRSRLGINESGLLSYSRQYGVKR